MDNAIIRSEAIQNELAIHVESINSLSKDLDEADKLLRKLDEITIPEELFVLNERLKNKILTAPGEGTIHRINKLGGVTKLENQFLVLISPHRIMQSPRLYELSSLRIRTLKVLAKMVIYG